MFNTLHHGRVGALPVNYNDDGREFSHSTNGSIISFYAAWEPFRFQDASEFFDVPILGIMAILAVMIVFRLLVNTYVVKLIKNSTTIEALFEGFYSLICPALHLDWELLFMQSNGRIPIAICWKR